MFPGARPCHSFDPVRNAPLAEQGYQRMNLEIMCRSVPNDFRKITLCKKVLISLIYAVAQGTLNIARPILFRQVICSWGFSLHCQPGEEMTFSLRFHLPNG
jgi:hypothetical protein